MFKCNMATANVPTATVTAVNPNGETVTATATGSGSVEAIFNTLELLVEGEVHILDYRVTSIGKGRDALGEAVVNLSINGEVSIGRDVAQDVLEASAKAYLNAINRQFRSKKAISPSNESEAAGFRIEASGITTENSKTMRRRSSMEKRVAVLPGDGIGPEVTEAAVKVLEVIARRFNHTFHVEYGVIGGAAIDKHQNPLPDETIALCEASDAVLLGAVGGPKWDQNPSALRPEKGLLAIRKHFDLFANLRPVKAVPSLLHASPLKEEVAKDVDMMIVRELTGGLYFGEPSRRTADAAVDSLVYTREEIERIVV